MREHVFLCGLSAEQAAEHPAGTPLSLDEYEGNLKLKVDRLRERLAGNEPKRLTDFIEIASYVFAADRTKSRGPLWDPGFGAGWWRNFLLVIAVRELEFWQRQDVKATLCDALGFLSEDCWRFEFVSNLRPRPLQGYLGLERARADGSDETSIVLFSGGLDSLAGAVHELGRTDNHLVLVSHRNLPIVGSRQVELADKLAAVHSGRVTHVWIDNSLTNKLPERETTQRTRSFFFTAMAAVTAHIEKSPRIRFYENGVMSINLPFATQVVGTRPSIPADRLPEPAPEETTASSADEVTFIAVDAKHHRILISDRAELYGSAIFPVMRFLIEASMQDRGSGLLSKHHRCFPAKVIAAALVHLEEGAVRSAIYRARGEFAEAERDLYGTEIDPNAIIERIDRKGYRLNPNIKAVTLDEFNRR